MAFGAPPERQLGSYGSSVVARLADMQSGSKQSAKTIEELRQQVEGLATDKPNGR
jgi:hypothetical protein